MLMEDCNQDESNVEQPASSEDETPEDSPNDQASGNSSDDEASGNSSDEDLEHTESKKRKLKTNLDPNKRIKIENGFDQSQKKSKNDLYKPPTAEELYQLRQTQTLSNSNTFRLQIEGLLEEVKVKRKYKNLFDNWFGSFKNVMDNLPEYKETKISELNKTQAKSIYRRFINKLIDTHKSKLKSDQDLTLKFIKPHIYHDFGLHKINAGIGPKLSVQINIVMPKSCFFEKDYLNNRYLLKRNYYMSYISLHLQEAGLCSKLHVIQDSVICIIPNNSEKIQIYVHITPEENSFKLSRFEPAVNNLRETLYDDFSDLTGPQLKAAVTPFYNSVILNDLTLVSNYNFAENVLKELNNVRDGIKLLLIWLKQRNLCCDNGFHENLAVQTVVYLVLKRRLNKYMSSYQVIRNVWVFLSTSDWHEEPISICEDVKVEKFKSFQKHFGVVFLDASGCYNLAAFLHLSVYLKVRSEAEMAVKYLDNIKFDLFETLFMTKMNPELQYDALLILKDKENFKNVYNSIDTSKKCEYVGCYKMLVTKHISSLLSKALNKRTVHVVPLSSEEEGEGKTNNAFPEIIFGLTLNGDEAFKVTERGPSSNTSEGQQFKKFWDGLSECRRFADGSICEAVYFPSHTRQEKRQIFKKIIDFVVKKKLKVPNYSIISDELEDMVVLKNCVTPFPVGTCEEATANVNIDFDELSTKLRECNLPLEITSVQGVSELFSYTAAFPPIATNYRWGGKLTSCKGNNIILNDQAKFGTVPKYVEPIDCVIQLGMNSKWPHDLEALRHLKVGFYLELSKKLHQEFQILSNVKPEYLEVLYKGLVFRFRLYNPREISEMKKSKSANGVISYKDTEESMELERNLLILPKIRGALHGIQSANPTFGPSVTLIKRWLRSQLIDDHYIPDVVIDLLNAALFLNGAPYDDAQLPQVAFIRFVKHIAEFDYNSQPVVVDFNDELTKEQLDTFKRDFEKNRQKYPPLCIITPYDEEKFVFSKKCTKEVLRRFGLLAKSTFDVLQISISTQNMKDTQELFVPNLTGYNVLIHLNPLLNPRRHQQLDFIKNDNSKLLIEEYNEEQNSKIPVVAFNPVEIYVKELRENYGNLALFFYDPYGGNTIGVLWHPKVFENTEFKVSHIEGKKLMNNALVMNKAAVIEDFFMLGNGVVKSIVEQDD